MAKAALSARAALSIRCVAHVAVLSALLLFVSACLQPSAVRIEFTRGLVLNDHLREDRNALTEAQALRPAHSGAYHDGDLTDAFGAVQCVDCEVIAPVTPALVDAERLEKLMQSGCLWVADPQSGAGASDVEAMSVSWELVAEVRREGMHLRCDSPTRFGLCRLRDPHTAQPIAFQPLDEPFVACPNPEPPPVESMTVDFGTLPNNLPLTLSNDEGPLFLDEDVLLASSPLVMQYVTRAPSADPLRTCPGSADAPRAIASGSTQTALLSGGLGCGAGTSPNGGVPIVSACGRRCTAFAPAGDSALRMLDTSTNVSRWLTPNLMTVKGTAKLTRSMTATEGNTARTWRVGVSADGQRLHENFSPNLILDGVRVFVPGPDPTIETDDSAPPLASLAELNAPGVTISGSFVGSFFTDGTPNTKSFSASCPLLAGANGWVATFGPNHGCVGSQSNEVGMALTPAYAHRHLIDAHRLAPLNDPLRWTVRLSGAATTPVALEFRLRAPQRGTALLAAPAAHDFGGVVIGDHGDGWLTYTNLGSSALRVTAARLGGANPADFRYRLIADAAPVPIPVHIRMKRGSRIVREIEPGAALIIDRARAATVGPVHTRLIRPERDGKTVLVYDNEIRYDGAVGIHRDAPRPVPYVFPVGTVPLDAIEAYTAATLPYVLAPGQALRVAVQARPGVVGQRVASLRVDAESLINPNERASATAVLRVDGDSGALPALWPAWATLGTVGRSGAQRNMLLVNDGDRPLERRRLSTTGNGYSVVAGNAAVQSIGPGESEVFAVRIVPACPMPYGTVSGSMLIDTSEGTQRAELSALVDCARP